MRKNVNPSNWLAAHHAHYVPHSIGAGLHVASRLFCEFDIVHMLKKASPAKAAAKVL